MTQPSLTLVSVTGHDDYSQSSVYALMHSYQQLRERIADLRCVLISPTRPAFCPDYIRHISTPPFSYLEYNAFMVFCLQYYIETDFCLTVQDDGWVINGNAWRDEFWQYDFIGAPVGQLIMTEWRGEIRQKFPENISPIMPLLPDERCYRPQNGGVSLRSQKLLQLPKQLNLKLHICAPNANHHTTQILKWSFATHHEDVFLTVQERAKLEAHGIRFAPVELAEKFSTEHFDCNPKYGMPVDNLLAFHLASTVRIISPHELTLVKDLRPIFQHRLTLNEFAQTALVQKLLQLGFTLHAPANFFDE